MSALFVAAVTAGNGSIPVEDEKENVLTQNTDTGAERDLSQDTTGKKPRGIGGGEEKKVEALIQFHACWISVPFPF